MARQIFSFVGGATGQWRVSHVQTMIGEALPAVPYVEIVEGNVETGPESAAWMLRGATSYERYVHKAEQQALIAHQPPIGRPEASCAALILMKKSDAWWAMPQDERRTIFEERSHHIQIGMHYLPSVARRLHHCQELGEPFDFLAWLEYAPNDTESFDQLLHELRATEEWHYVEREIDIRLVRS